MRIDTAQAHHALEIIRRHFGAEVEVKLFGSRVNDTIRGGDVDLYVKVSDPVALLDEIRCQVELADMFDLDVDLLVDDGRNDKPIYHIADRTGISLAS